MPSGTSEAALAVDLALSPNPSTDEARLTYTLAEQSGGQILVFDLTGREVQRFDFQGNSGTVQLGTALPSGTYFVRLASEGLLSEPIKLMKQ
jgi:hypothetical protein